MPSAATIRFQIETALARRIPSALTPAPRVIRPVAPTGVSEVDELLDGGLPVGAITEIVGPESSGRTGIALSFVSQLTHAGKVCAWVFTAGLACACRRRATLPGVCGPDAIRCEPIYVCSIGGRFGDLDEAVLTESGANAWLSARALPYNHWGLCTPTMHGPL